MFLGGSRTMLGRRYARKKVLYAINQRKKNYREAEDKVQK